MKIFNLHHFIALIACLVYAVPGTTAYAGNNSTTLRIKGSDTLNKVLKEWSKAYQKLRSDLQIDVVGGGSGNGIAALINNHVEIAAASRLMKSRELQLFTKKYAGIQPIAHTVALDAISIVVHNSNPINGISLHQLKSIYANDDKFTRWTDLKVQVPGCQDQIILPLNRKNNSGTYDFFRQAIFNDQEHFDSKLITMDSSETLITTVSQNPCAIGYSGMAFITGQVKTLCVSKKTGAKIPCVPPTVAFALDNTYPLSRSLYLYTLGEPQGETKNFLEWVKGPEGREILLRTGYVLPPEKPF